MKLLNSFLLKHFLRILLLCLGAFIAIYLLIDFFENINDFIDHNAAPGDYLSYLLNSIPLIFGKILPLAILMTVVLTLCGLGRTNEITAMRSCGFSLWRIIQPFMLMALLLSGLLLLVNEFVAPHSAHALNQLLEIKLKNKQQISLTRNEIWFRNADKIINVRLADPDQKKLFGVTIFVLNKSFQLKQRLESELVVYTEGKWIAEKLRIRDFDPQTGNMVSAKILQHQPLHINRTPRDFTTQERQSNELNFQQLSGMVKKLEQEGFDATHQRVDMHNRIATPFSCLIMAFLGVPFALQKGRSSNIAIGIGLSLGIGVIYFILQAILTAFGYSGALPPSVAAWATNIIFLMLGVWMQLSLKE